MFFVFFRYWIKYNYCTFVVLPSILATTYNTNYTYLFYVSGFSQFKKYGLPSQKAYDVGVFGSNLVKKIDIKQICYFTYTPKPNPHISPFPPSFLLPLPILPISHFFPTPPPCFPLYPTPSKDPHSLPSISPNLPTHPYSPHSNLPIPTSQISLPQTLPWLSPKSIPNPSSNNPKTVNTIPHPSSTIQNNRWL